MESEDLAREAALAGAPKEAAHPVAIAAARVAERVREHQVALARPEVAADFLAVALGAAAQVQHVVRDLKGQAEQVAEAIEAAEVPVVAIGDQRADAHRVDEAVPGCLLEHEPEVVVGADGEVVVAHPAELRRLPLEALDEHVVDLVEDAKGYRGRQPLAALAEQAYGQRVHGVAGVHSDRDADAAVHRRHAAPRVAAILDVVVHEKRVVEHLDPRLPARRQPLTSMDDGPCLSRGAHTLAQRLEPSSRVDRDDARSRLGRAVLRGRTRVTITAATAPSCADHGEGAAEANDGVTHASPAGRLAGAPPAQWSPWRIDGGSRSR